MYAQSQKPGKPNVYFTLRRLSDCRKTVAHMYIVLTNSTDPYCRLLKTSRRTVRSDAGELEEKKLRTYKAFRHCQRLSLLQHL
jgi:hypothetical protein